MRIALPTLKRFSKIELWFALAAILILLVSVVFCVGLLVRDQQIYNEHNNRNAIYAPTTEDIGCNLLSGIERIHCLAAEYSSNQNSQSVDYLARMDIIAQRRMAFWTAAIGVVGVLSLPFSMIAIGLLLLTLRDTRRIAKIESGGSVTPVKARTGHNGIAYFTRITVKKHGTGAVTDIYFDGEVELIFTRTIADESGQRQEKLVYHERSTVVDFATDGDFELILAVNESSHRIVQNTINEGSSPYMRISGRIFFTDAFGDNQLFKVYLAGSLDDKLAGELHNPRKAPPA